MRSDKHTIYHARLQDTFGDYGVILFAHIEKGHDSWSIKSFLMSCRIFGRNIEEAFFAFLLGEAFKERISTITIAYKESEKNVPARDFITSHFTNFSREVKDGIKSPEWVTLRNV
jgi:FkbH-like protein